MKYALIPLFQFGPDANLALVGLSSSTAEKILFEPWGGAVVSDSRHSFHGGNEPEVVIRLVMAPYETDLLVDQLESAKLKDIFTSRPIIEERIPVLSEAFMPMEKRGDFLLELIPYSEWHSALEKNTLTFLIREKNSQEWVTVSIARSTLMTAIT